MDQRYNIYYAGQLLDGHEPGAVRAGLARLFKADVATLDKLFSGKAQLIKKHCDRDTALKYKQAMERIGARPLIKQLEDEQEAPPPTAAEAQTAAEKIAALAAAPDLGNYDTTKAAQEQATPAATADTGSLDLCPDGTEVLRPDERAVPEQAQIDTAGLAVDTDAQRLSEEPPPPPPAPDTSHLQMGEVGESIPTLPAEQAPLNPSTEGIALTPEGTDLRDCNPPEAPPPQLDLSGIDLAPEGTEVLTDEERSRKKIPPPPDTDHIDLAD